MSDSLFLINKNSVRDILCKYDAMILDIIKETYKSFSNELCTLPNSVFLRFPNEKDNRIIGLPAYVGGDINIAGIKWISSFPDNIRKGKERASALIMLNSLVDGRVNVVLDGADISARRTAASAVLAAITLHKRDITEAGFIGCGKINREVMSVLKNRVPTLNKVFLYDKDRDISCKCAETWCNDLDIELVENYQDLFKKCALVFVATTASTPYIDKIDYLTPNHTILGISLRDFSVEMVMRCQNIVDSIEHVNRENTSIHLTSKQLGNTDFISDEIGKIFENDVFRRENRPVLFSPFGLGVLDVALAHFVKERVLEEGGYIEIDNFYSIT